MDTFINALVAKQFWRLTKSTTSLLARILQVKYYQVDISFRQLLARGSISLGRVSLMLKTSLPGSPAIFRMLWFPIYWSLRMLFVGLTSLISYLFQDANIIWAFPIVVLT